jgi:uncharacterized repeat protein (TIGR01451 family)
MRTKLFITILILALALSGPPGEQTARAADITVTTTADDLDAAEGSCGAITILSLPGPDGVTSLREAMCAANNNAGPDTIQFDIPGCESGCTIQPAIALPVLTDEETTIDGYTQDGASPATGAVSATLLIEIDGSAIASNNGLNIASSGNEIRGLAINRFSMNGIAIGGSGATDNVISGNHIGTDRSGSVNLGNGLDGIFIGLGAQNNTVGGDEPAKRNVISGNDWDGVAIHGSGTMSNMVKGNFIGVAADGWVGCANGLHGVYVYGGTQNNTVGRGNVISGNSENGVLIYGDGTTGNAVLGNRVGLDGFGLTALPNGEAGIKITEGAQDNVIGGEAGYGANFISGNDTGIWIDGEDTTGNWVHHNAIGMTMYADPLGNTRDGVHLSFGAQNNTIGPDNLIVFNGDDGVGVDTPLALGNIITENTITANSGLGIHLTNGAHNGIAAPVISSAPKGPGDITGTACPGCTVEVFINTDDDGEGMGYLGSAVADGGGNFSLTVPHLSYPYLTATATDAVDGTSEFSDVFTAEIPVLRPDSSKAVDRETVSPGAVLTYTITLSNTGTWAAKARLTDTLPSEVAWANACGASAGTLTWDEANDRLLWSGEVGLSAPVVITYQVTLRAGVPNGASISNRATVNDGFGYIFDIVAPDVTVIAHYQYLPLALRSEAEGLVTASQERRKR